MSERVRKEEYTQAEDDALALFLLQSVRKRLAGVKSVYHEIEIGFFLWRGEMSCFHEREKTLFSLFFSSLQKCN